MSNLEIVQSFYQAAARRDLPAIQALLHPEVVWTQTPALPWGGVYQGTAGLTEFMGKLYASIDSSVEITEFIDAAESIVAIGWTRGTVKANGATFEIRIAHVHTLAEGKIISIRPYIDTPTMLKALE